ncbi:hypothetical protein [Sinorhizobium americanum]|uniref:hypothetical protein n=1 Tax=Sinorhizobium americanum TaxID=194963 RepID=UPI001FD92E02|nr:hypothetical protein [Sinorhizobium americanum]
MRRLVLPVLACIVAGCAPVIAGTSNPIDQSLVQIEQVNLRLSGAPSAVKTVSKALAENGNAEVPAAEALLETAVHSSFDSESMGAAILKNIGEVDGGSIDPEAFARAAAAFEEGRGKIARIYEAQDQTAAKEIEARLADPETGARLRQLTDLMAAPELAVESAFTSQLMYAAMEAFSDPSAAELASSSETPHVIASLRSRNENEKPIAKDAARLEEQGQLSFILATLSYEDLSVLLDFYRSSGGKTKRQALVDSYVKVSDQANTKMLQAYFSALANYLKTHPRPQQQ